MELTKKGTPHHHLILGPIGVDRDIMCMRRFELAKWKRRFYSCDCIAHELARHWKEITGDSYIVHGREVIGAEGAASYMGKYLTKTFGREDRTDFTGMVRRWSSSRGWPGNSDLHLRQTDTGGWEERLFRSGGIEERFLGGPDDLLERNGEDIVKQRVDKANTRKLVKDMRRYLNYDSDVRKAID